jgi:hypothetical protein
LQPTTETKSAEIVEQVFAAIAEFEKTQTRHKDVGARDTEPDGVFQLLIDRAARGDGPPVPRTGQGWDLYTQSCDCEQAAKDLHDAALKVVQLIESCKIQDLQLLRGRLKEYCWRVY